jgi:hypothetical protein
VAAQEVDIKQAGAALGTSIASAEMTMDEMSKELRGLGADRTTHSGYIAEYESANRPPSLLTLLAYSMASDLSISICHATSSIRECLLQRRRYIPYRV